MNIFEVAMTSGQELATLRKQEKLGLRRFTNDDLDIWRIRYHLSRNLPLRLADQITILNDRNILQRLGNYRVAACEQLRRLGSFDRTTAPREIAETIPGAAAGDHVMISRLIDWLQASIPDHVVDYYWLAVRLTRNAPDSLQKRCIRNVWRALRNCQNRREFRGWFRVAIPGRRGPIVYQRPHYDL